LSAESQLFKGPTERWTKSTFGPIGCAVFVLSSVLLNITVSIIVKAELILTTLHSKLA